MGIGIICAIPQELDHLAGALEGAATTEVARFAFRRGRLDGRPVVLVGSGIGKVAAALVATLLVERFGCRSLVFSGVAGGLDPALSIGDVVIADRLVQHDAGWIEGGRLHTYQAGHVPFFNPTDELGFALPAATAEALRGRLEGLVLAPLSTAAGGAGRPPRIVFGTVLTGDQYLACEATRARLFQELGGVAIEMEGAAIAQTAAILGVPWLVIRALSDLAGHEAHFDFGRFVIEVAASSALILRRALPILPD